MEYQWDTVTEEELKHLYYEEEMTDRKSQNGLGFPWGKWPIREGSMGYPLKIWYTSSLWMKIRSCLHS